MSPSLTLRINRAPVLTLWRTAVVAERLGMPRGRFAWIQPRAHLGQHVANDKGLA
jgi:hypothetical protein